MWYGGKPEEHMNEFLMHNQICFWIVVTKIHIKHIERFRGKLKSKVWEPQVMCPKKMHLVLQTNHIEVIVWPIRNWLSNISPHGARLDIASRPRGWFDTPKVDGRRFQLAPQGDRPHVFSSLYSKIHAQRYWNDFVLHYNYLF